MQPQFPCYKNIVLEMAGFVLTLFFISKVKAFIADQVGFGKLNKCELLIEFDFVKKTLTPNPTRSFPCSLKNLHEIKLLLRPSRP